MVSVLSGNRNFEGRIHPDVQMNYLASPPLCVAYALAGTMDIDLVDEPLGQDSDGSPVYLRDIWPSEHEIARHVAAGGPLGHVPQELRRGVRRRRALARARRARGRPLRLGPGTRPTCASRPTSTAMPAEPEPLADIAGRARAGHARRLRHHRPHLAGRLDPPRRARRRLPAGARRRAPGLQLLRLAARQPRGDGARHVRQRPPAQPARAGHRGRRDAPPARRRAALDLRRRDALPGRGRAARRARRQGVRLGLLARLGGQGHRCCSACAP